MFDPGIFITDKHGKVVLSVYDVQTIATDLRHIRARLDLLEARPDPAEGVRNSLRVVQDLVCTHDELVYRAAWQSTFGYISIPESFACKRCGRELDPAKAGHDELMKRVKKED